VPPLDQSIRVSRLVVRTFCYPTEERGVVEGLLLGLIPEDLAEAVGLERSRLKSAHKYSFGEFRLDLRGKAAADVLIRILASLSESDRLELARSLPDRVEGSRLYLRLDKQELALGATRLYRGGIGGHVHVVASFRGPAPLEALLHLLEGGGSN